MDKGDIADLKRIRAALEDWKFSAAGSRRPRYPDELKNMIVAAARKHGLRELGRCLGIERNSIRHWMKSIQPQPPQPDPAPERAAAPTFDFVELQGLAAPVGERVEIILPGGIIVRVSSGVPPLFVGRLVKALATERI